MRIGVKLMLTFQEKTPHGETPFDLDLPPGTTITEALESLSISPDTPKVILINGRVTDPEQELAEGDELTVFPPLEGG